MNVGYNFIDALRKQYTAGKPCCTLDDLRQICPSLPDISSGLLSTVPERCYIIDYESRPYSFYITPDGFEYLNDHKYARTTMYLGISAAVFSLLSLLVGIYALFR